jgi:hypothetical protein
MGHWSSGLWKTDLQDRSDPSDLVRAGGRIGRREKQGRKIVKVIKGN